jgi:hypothetical protein
MDAGRGIAHAKAMPYTGASAGGTAGTSLTVRFTVK